MAAGKLEFILFSFDGGQAFATGRTFEEFSALFGQYVGKVELYVPKADLDCLRQLPDFKDLDPQLEALIMLKQIYGLKGAPRAWRKTLHQVLIQWLSCRQLYPGPGLYCVHRKDEVEQDNIDERARQHNEEQLGICNFRNTKPRAYVFGNLQCLLCVHVDDIKCTARRDTAGSPVKCLNDKAGQRKTIYASFLHTGVQRESSSGVVFTHQYVYIDSITPTDNNIFIGKDEGAVCDTFLHEAYRSVLGAVAWIVLTRTELAVYVQAFRRRACAPRIKDRKRLHILIRYMKRRKCG